MAEVRSINALRADKENDNSLLSPLETLEDAAEDIRSGKCRCDKLVILMLDIGDGGDYRVGYRACSLRSSEAVALLEAGKQNFMDHLLGRR